MFQSQFMNYSEWTQKLDDKEKIEKIERQKQEIERQNKTK